MQVLEYCDSGALDRLFLDREWADWLSNHDLVIMTFDLVKGLRYIQSKGILHR